MDSPSGLVHGEWVGDGECGGGAGGGVGSFEGCWSSLWGYWSSSASAMGSMRAVTAVLLIHIEKNHGTNMNPASCNAAGSMLQNCKEVNVIVTL